jgi:hypothetical protein
MLYMRSNAKTDKVQHRIGTGKTSLAHLIAHGTPLRSGRPTVGCSTYITTVGSPEDAGAQGSQRQTFVELWDIGTCAGAGLATYMRNAMGFRAHAHALKKLCSSEHGLC